MTLQRHDIDNDAATPGSVFRAPIGRRRFLTIGGATVASAAVLAACGDDGESEAGVARVGIAPSTTALPDAVINDVVLLRTVSSIEHSIVAVYDEVIADAALLDPFLRDQMTRFRDDHIAHAELFEGLTAEAGGEPWPCSNARFDEVVVTPVMRAITGAEATDTLAAREPSDDPRRDVLNFTWGLESLAAATYQAFVPMLSLPALRVESITAGAHEARHAALLAMTITGIPEGYIDPSDVTNAGEPAPTTTSAPATTQDIAAPSSDAPDPVEEGTVGTEIPTVYAIPSQFGQLGAIPIVVGAPDENGTRLTVRLETPSLNTLVYEYLTPEC